MRHRHGLVQGPGVEEEIQSLEHALDVTNRLFSSDGQPGRRKELQK
jgi:hypothetical protein